MDIIVGDPDSAIARIEQDGDLITTHLIDGTVVKAWFHVCASCTSADTWIVRPDDDPENKTGDKRRRQVRGFAWNRTGGRGIVEVTTFTHVLDHEGAVDRPGSQAFFNADD